MTRASELTRRKILAGLTLVGVTGAGAGATTGAYLSAREQATGTIRAGEVLLTLDCEEGTCTRTDDGVAIALENLEPGNGGTERISLSIDGNPSRLWLRTECPVPADLLSEALLVRLSIERDGDETSEQLFPSEGWGTLDELKRALSDGVRLDESEPCPSAEDDLELVFKYKLPADATWAASASTEFTFELFGEQCRHVSEEAAQNPFEATDCPKLECPDCVELGKVEVQNDRLDLETYAFDELEDEFEDDKYELDVLALTNKEENGGDETVCAAFRLLRNGEELDAPPICKVEVKGGSNTETYEINPPSTRTLGELCSAWSDESSSDSDSPPAISNLVIYVCSDEENGGDA